NELALGFDCDRAMFAYRDAEMERIFVWSVSGAQAEHISPENLPLTRTDALLLDWPDVSLCWNQMDGGDGGGFGWDRRDGRRRPEVPRMPNLARQEFGLRSILVVSCDFGGQPVGRIILGNGRRRFLSQDLGALDRAARHLGPPLENLFLLRRLRTRAIEGERS